MKTLYFVTRGYPTKENSSFAFVQPLIHKIADAGIACVVVAPQRVFKTRKLRPYRWHDVTANGNKISIIQPKYIPFGRLRFFGIKLTTLSRERAAVRALNALKEKPDAVYAHFWDCALIASAYTAKHRVPLIAVSGESTVAPEHYFSRKQIERRKALVDGVICVSTKNYHESAKLGLITHPDSVLISPNAIDTDCFYKCDKVAAKQALGIDEDSFVISYVGRYSERKGVNRLIAAAKACPEVKLILIGYGGELDESEQILIAKRVAHEEVVTYLNASDVYCLPTQAEGCCNSIIEAMACGLPVISSDAEFNQDILDDTTAILIDPNDIDAIANAITTLKNNKELRVSMGNNAYTKAKAMTIQGRAQTILEFINKTVTAYKERNYHRT